jgi:hypothetical protein
MSNHVISAFQQGHQAFPLVKVKRSNLMHEWQNLLVAIPTISANHLEEELN